ncbi:SHOCT domain-containing protein [Candidatus Bathyarchaeota archaeon]|nr:SHOCT domain-containing protein [Candidatus Bathyarchaeota archaeon]
MWFGWGMFMGPLFLVGFVILIYYLINSSKSEQHSHHNRTYHDAGRAIEILNERYAKGEITKEQFKEMQKELKS